MSAVASRTHIAVFCKPLIPGRVKTRLIPTLGEAAATGIYSQLVEHTLRTVHAATALMNASASLWVAGDVAHTSALDWSQRFSLPTYAQCEGDLGEKMFHCLATLARFDATVLLIGTDCPALNVSDLQAAAAALNASNPWVFAPAEDGGYVLVGTNAPARAPFANIAWSTPEVMQQTRAALRNHALSWQETRTLWDVDEATDVGRARQAGWIT